jgi:hypothetical protein
MIFLGCLLYLSSQIEFGYKTFLKTSLGIRMKLQND